MYDKSEVDLEWYCLPVKHRNACSNTQPYWYCWHPDEREKWVREMPADITVITEHKFFTWGLSWQEFCDQMFDKHIGTVCTLTGVRTQESFRRYKAVTAKKNDNYITTRASNGNVYTAHPIYDWSSEDVWIAVKEFGWDYNRTYDVYNKTSFYTKLLAQRVCPPFGEEPLRMLWIYSECFPDMWHKMLYRVPGVATAWRYGNTELYGIGTLEKPENKTWREYLNIFIDNYSGKEKITVIDNLNAIIRRHYQKTDDEIPEEDVHPLTGTSWKFVCKIAMKGDFKGRTAPMLEGKAIEAQKRLGIKSYDEAKKIYGRKSRRG